MKRETGLRTIILFVILALCAVSLYPTVAVFSKSNDHSLPLDEREREIYKKDHPKIASKSINLGLDLAGGTHIIVEIDKSKMNEASAHDVLDRTLEIVRNRVDQYGLSEPVITKSGDNRIIADLAGMGAEDARRLIGATALLEFKLVADVTEFKPILDRLDAFVAAKQRGQSSEQAAAAAPVKASSAVENVFGKVGDSSAQAVAAVDSAEDSAAADLGNFDPSARPFTALLSNAGNNIGVRSENYEKVRRILADKEVQQLLPSRLQFLWSRDEEVLADGTKGRILYLLKRRAEMTGSTISNATFQHAQGGLNAGELEVILNFKDLGPKEFARITGANVGRQLAIVLDSVVYSAPVIRGKIPNGTASITGVGNVSEAKQLAVVLRAGALPVPMKIVELRSVGPTLGEENIRSGIIAAVASMVLVLLFIAVYYRTAGLIANVALSVNMLITVSVLSAFQATLTLPGIAGLALTLGMAVDANILIMERIREEIAAGRSLRASIDAGYQKAFRAILDSNITVLGTAAILYYVGVGSIKGFGLTLLIGVGASMFTAIFVTRLLFDYKLKKDAKTIALGKTWGFLLNVKMGVIKNARIYAGLSIAAMVISVGAIVVKGPELGVDFTGGHVFQVKMQEKPDVEKIRGELSSFGIDPKVQTLGGSSNNEILVYTRAAENDSSLRAYVEQAVAGQGVIVGEETVGPTVGKDLQKSAIISILLALILVVLYIWFRFGVNGLGFGVAAVLALFHDALITLGVFVLMGWELNLDFVAAILTIVGYSVNDTIVIFDRVREISADNTSKASFAARVDQANNESFSRTIVIAFLVTLSIVMLVVFGGTSIRDMNVALLIGSIAGTWSTIALACPFVVWWNNRRIRPKNT